VEEKILFVDDEVHILESFRRTFHKRYRLATASRPEEALHLIQAEGPFAVVVSDLRMPGMDGIRFLARVQEVSPDTVRLILTGHADLDAAIAAVNEGHVFRFLTKPCANETMQKALAAALDQYRLVTAERELLRGTLRGSVRVLTDVLALVHPEAFGRAERLRRHASATARRLGVGALWRYEMAAMLSQIGCVTLPAEILRKRYAGTKLSAVEEDLYHMHPAVARGLLSNIPRLEEVIEIVGRQDERLIEHPDQPLGARILKVAMDFDDLEQQGLERENALAEMKSRPGWYAPEVLAAFELALFAEEGYLPKPMAMADLRPGMVLAKDVKTSQGILLLVNGQEVNTAIILRLETFANTHGVDEPVFIRVPLEAGPTRAAPPPGAAETGPGAAAPLAPDPSPSPSPAAEAPGEPPG
jgi:response regulator RpfG family c-di-GMP phosphodiesterase